MISIEEALETILAGVHPGRAETLPGHLTAGLVLAQDVVSDIDMPPFDRAAMDGYALAGVHESYEIAPEVAAGDPTPPVLQDGHAARIMTGAPVPPGADRVLMIEKVLSEDDRMVPREVPPPGTDICLRGEDMREGQLVLPKGSVMSPGRAGIAAMAGLRSLEVFARPSTGVLTTGAEVVDPGTRPGPSQVRNANMPLLDSLLSSAGYPAVRSIHCDDTFDDTAAAARSLMSSCEVLIVAGGISLGAYDVVAPALESLGTAFLFREVAMKPGKPMSFGILDGRPVFCLPGNPVSVLCTFEEFVLPALRRMSGHERCRRVRLRGRACFDHRQKPGRTGLLRVDASLSDGGWVLEMPSSSGSGDLMSTSCTNALAICPADLTGVSGGETLEFSLNHDAAGEGSWR